MSAYSRCSGQWIISPSGDLVALRGEAVSRTVKDMGIPKKDRLAVIDDVRFIFERVAKLVNADRAEKRERERDKQKNA